MRPTAKESDEILKIGFLSVSSFAGVRAGASLVPHGSHQVCTHYSNDVFEADFPGTVVKTDAQIVDLGDGGTTTIYGYGSEIDADSYQFAFNDFPAASLANLTAALERVVQGSLNTCTNRSNFSRSTAAVGATDIQGIQFQFKCNDSDNQLFYFSRVAFQPVGGKVRLLELDYIGLEDCAGTCKGAGVR